MDQRIANDCYLFATGLGSLLFGSPTSASFIGSVAMIVLATAQGATYGWLTLVSFIGYAGAVVGCARLLMRPIVPLTYAANRAEGHFRGAHIRFREYCESIAFFAGEAAERAHCDTAFRGAYDATRALLWREFPAMMFVSVRAPARALLCVLCCGAADTVVCMMCVMCVWCAAICAIKKNTSVAVRSPKLKVLGSGRRQLLLQWMCACVPCLCTFACAAAACCYHV
jgi:hypothetical protein